MPLDGVHLTESKTDSYSITPIVGYALNQQNLTMTDGNQTVDLTTANKTGSFSGLDSSYKTSWQGPFLGLSFNSNFNKKHDLEISGEYQIVDYNAEGNWNLRTDLAHPKSFEHSAQGSGKVINVKYSFKPGDSLSYSIALNYKRFETDAGNDRTFFSNGQNHDVRMDKAKWDSKGVNLGVGYEF